MQNAVSEPVKLKASTEILDRAGVRGGIELDGNLSVTDARPAADIISERLNRLASGAINVAAALAFRGGQYCRQLRQADKICGFLAI